MPGASLHKKRPLWYNLSLLNLPPPGLVSILHRVSGGLLFLAVIWALYLLESSLASAERFESIKQTLAQPRVRIVSLGLLWAYCHHFCAGIRYLLLDLDIGVELAPARASSIAVIAASLVLTALLGWLLLW